MTEQEFEATYMAQLNDQQRAAVKAVTGPVLLLAVPGSGKTTVLVTRLGYMVLVCGAAPEEITTVTYTTAAARDMRARFASLFGAELAGRMRFSTINSLALEIIRVYSAVSGRGPAFETEGSEAELSRILRQLYQDINHDFADDTAVKDMSTAITYIKNMELTQEEIEALDSRVDRLPDIYAGYCAELKRRSKMDFDDQLVYALRILKRFPEVLDRFRNRCRRLCVDEAQDTSKIQHSILKLLGAGSDSLFMVGDEDQSIYGFRAAYPQALLDFTKTWPEGRVLKMEQNFRSTPPIVEAANAFISGSRYRLAKTMFPDREGGAPIHMVSVNRRQAQFRLLFDMAKSCSRDTAVLFRNNDSAVPLIDRLERSGIPYNCRSFEMLLFSDRTVCDVRDIIRFAENPMDGELFLSLYYKLKLYLNKQAAQTAVSLSQRRGQPIPQVLLTFERLNRGTREAIEDLIYNLNALRKDSAADALRRIRYVMHYSEFAAQRRLDCGRLDILELLAENEASAASLLDRLDRLKEIISSHQNKPGTPLTLSTIHSAKGLEFDHVFLPDVFDGLLPAIAPGDIETEEDERQYEEERRLFYVAITRARQELTLYHGYSPSCFAAEVLRALPGNKSRESRKAANPAALRIGPGSRLVHKQFGRCRVTEVSGGIIKVRFDDGSVRQLSLQVCLDKGLLGIEA